VRSPPSNNGCAGSAAGRSAVASIHQAFDAFERQYYAERSVAPGPISTFNN
jgi:hypothetical protein